MVAADQPHTDPPEGAVRPDDYAAEHGLDPAKVKRTATRKRLQPVHEEGAATRVKRWYRRSDLDAIYAPAPDPGLVTLAEYAQSIGLTPTTIANTWRTRYADLWPDPVSGGRRGAGPARYRRADLERVRRARAGLAPDPVGDAADLLTRSGAEEAAGVSSWQWSRLRRDGVLGGPVVSGDGTERWARGDVEGAVLRAAERSAG